MRKKNGGLTLETVAELRAMIHSLDHRCRQQILCTADTCLSADEAPSICPVCGGERWYVQKTRPRHGKTLAHGQFEARETVRALTLTPADPPLLTKNDPPRHSP